MILTASHLLRELRWVPPAVIIIGSMVPYLNQWVIIRVLTLPLPTRVYQRLEERLYSNYQSVVGFFYEIWSGVEVCRTVKPLSFNIRERSMGYPKFV